MFALVDANSFYASCERVFRPDLEQRPIVVLSNNDGCVIARSKLAKELGVEMAAPFFQIKDMLERLGADTSFMTPNEVSKVHCKIVRTPGAAGMEYSLYDLQSRCGTYLNGKAICQGDEGIVLSQGDVISLGASHVSTYVFHRRQSGKNHV